MANCTHSALSAYQHVQMSAYTHANMTICEGGAIQYDKSIAAVAAISGAVVRALAANCTHGALANFTHLQMSAYTHDNMTICEGVLPYAKYLTAIVDLEMGAIRSTNKTMPTTTNSEVATGRAVSKNILTVPKFSGSILRAIPAPILNTLEQIGSYIKATWHF